MYGSSEVFALTATWPLDAPTPQRWAGGGRVVHPGIEVRVAGGPGVEGELEFRGPTVVDGYLGADPDVFTAEIEVRLAAHPAVHTARVVGVEGADGATIAVGFVTLDGDEPGDLRAWCAEVLAPFKVPAAVHVLDEMPTTSGRWPPAS